MEKSLQPIYLTRPGLLDTYDVVVAQYPPPQYCNCMNSRLMDLFEGFVYDADDGVAVDGHAHHHRHKVAQVLRVFLQDNKVYFRFISVHCRFSVYSTKLKMSI